MFVLPTASDTQVAKQRFEVKVSNDNYQAIRDGKPLSCASCGCKAYITESWHLIGRIYPDGLCSGCYND